MIIVLKPGKVHTDTTYN